MRKTDISHYSDETAEGSAISKETIVGGVFSGIGPGSISITDFWHENDHEYAVGRMTWPDGIPAVIFLVRP